jgi:tRNA(fMet)-specific endonuclease VapC
MVSEVKAGSTANTDDSPISAYDLQIAALAKLSEGIALTNNLTLVTHNTREFERVEGLSVEDWEVDG